MASLEYVQNCISRPPNHSKTDYIYFHFNLIVEDMNYFFYFYKDIVRIGAFSEFIFSKYPNSQILEIDKNSNDIFYNNVFNIFSVPNGNSFKCYKIILEPDYTLSQIIYYFNFDDLPNNKKGKIYLNHSSLYPFGKKIFNDVYYWNNPMVNNKDYPALYSVLIYTTTNGGTCTGYRVPSSSTSFNNASYIFLPLSVSYSVVNNDLPESPYYEGNYFDKGSINGLVYYVTLGDFTYPENSTCCLAECFGITE